MPRPLAVSDEEKEEFIKDYRELGSIQAVAAKWNIATRTAAKALDRFQIKRERGRRRKDEYHPKLGVWSDRKIAKEMGISHQAVARARTCRGIPPVQLWVVPAEKEG